MSELNQQLDQSLTRLVGRALDAEPDWQDVRARAARARRRTILVALLACLSLAVCVSAALAYGGDLWQLVAGKPVSTKRLSAEERRMFASLATGKPVLRTQPNSPQLRHLGREVSVRLLANRDGYTFYVVELKGRRPGRCFATGRAWKPELFGSMSCPLPGVKDQFPSAAQPLMDFSAFDLRHGPPQLQRLAGFAAVAVKKVGLLGHGGKVVATIPVVNSTYFSTVPRSGVEAIVALDAAGKRVYCEPIPVPDGCHDGRDQEQTTPRAETTAPPPRPKPIRIGRQLQHGKDAAGASVEVYAPGIAVFDLGSISARIRRLIVPGEPACLRARFLNGRWLVDEAGGPTSSQATGALRVQFVHPGEDFFLPYDVPPPYAGCEIGGLYGHRWNDAFGTRAAVEIPLTAEGRHFFNDRASARDLAYFVRSGRVQRIRLSADPRPGLEAFVHRFPNRVLELPTPGATAPEHTIGFWIGDRTIVFTATSSTGRRLFVVAKRGTLKLPSKNLGDLAFVF